MYFKGYPAEAASRSPYYLLFARKSNPDALNYEVLVDFNIFEMSLFSCLPESEINMVKRKLELAIYQTKYGKDPSSFVLAVNAAMLELEIWVEGHLNCCPTGDCETCLDFEESKAHLELMGFSGQEVSDVEEIFALPMAPEIDPHVVAHQKFTFNHLNSGIIDPEQSLNEWVTKAEELFTPMRAEIRLSDDGKLCSEELQMASAEVNDAFFKIFVYVLEPEEDSDEMPWLYTKVVQGEPTGSGKTIRIIDVGNHASFDMETMKSSLSEYITLCGCSVDISVELPCVYNEFSDNDPLIVVGPERKEVYELIVKDFSDVVQDGYLGALFSDWLNSKYPHSHPEKTDGKPGPFGDRKVPRRVIAIDSDAAASWNTMLKGSPEEAAALFGLHGMIHLAGYSHVPSEYYEPTRGWAASADGIVEQFEGYTHGHTIGDGTRCQYEVPGFETIKEFVIGREVRLATGEYANGCNVYEDNFDFEKKIICDFLK